MAYKEPGVYLQVQNNPRGAIAQEGAMIPLIIGTGASKLKTTIAMVRASGQEDTFPFTSVVEIQHIGYLRTGASDWAETEDYVFVSEENVITWEDTKGPAEGETYYVTLVYSVETTQYEPLLCSSVDQVVAKFGPDIQENETDTPVCPVSLGAQIALNSGAPSVWVLQVAIAGATVAGSDYSSALNTYAKFIPSIWRMVPMDQSDDINGAIVQHIGTMSTYEERMERSGFLAKPYATDDDIPTVFADVLSSIGGFAESMANKRVATIYPDMATKTLSDGVARSLGAPYILASLAGLTASLPPQRSYTRLNIPGFTELLGVQMTRTEMNKLAEKGVMVLTQTATGAAITIRHGVSTDMSTTQSRENSILQVQDYMSKNLRLSCEGYIGRYNINPELIAMVKGTIEGVFTNAIKNKIINDGKVTTIYQDEDNPDTIIVSCSVLPPYPCNYIDITLVLE